MFNRYAVLVFPALGSKACHESIFSMNKVTCVANSVPCNVAWLSIISCESILLPGSLQGSR